VSDRAIVPVVGVLLLVAITIILSAVVGVYAFGYTDELIEPRPSVAITSDYDRHEHTLVLEPVYSDDIDWDNVEVHGPDGSVSWTTLGQTNRAIAIDGQHLSEPQEGNTYRVTYHYDSGESYTLRIIEL
jgi:flagellin-like protein